MVALAVDPISPSIVYAATVGGGVFKTTNGGATWGPINTGLPPFRPGQPFINSLALAIDPVTPSTLYVSVDSSQCVGANCFPFTAVFKTTNGGASWGASMSGLAGSGRVLSLAVDPVTPATLYAGHQFGMFKTTTGGTSWSPIDTGLPGGGHFSIILAVHPLVPATVYLGLDRGMFKTIDGGASWNPASAGLPALPVQSLAIDPTAAGTVYAGPAFTAAPTSPEFR